MNRPVKRMMQKALKKRRRWRNKYPLLVFIGPSACGKSTLTRELPELFPGIKRICSCTTRKPRAGEVDGVHYHFLTKEEFERGIAAGDFAEHKKLFESGDYYGRRFKDMSPLEDGVCYADMTEHGIRTFRQRRFRIICIRIVPKHHALVRDAAERATADAERQRIRIRVDHKFTNSHRKGGKERALRAMRRIVARYWATTN